LGTRSLRHARGYDPRQRPWRFGTRFQVGRNVSSKRGARAGRWASPDTKMPSRRTGRVGPLSGSRTRRRSRRGAYALAGLALACSRAVGAQEAPVGTVEAELEWRVAELQSRGSLRIGQDLLHREEIILAVYEARGFAPLWTNAAASESLRLMVKEAYLHGLDPEAYHLAALSRSGDGPRRASTTAEQDLLSTDALVRLSHDLRFGRVRPKGFDARVPGPGALAPADAWPFEGPDAAARLVEIVETNRVRSVLSDLAPRHDLYRALTDALAGLRKVYADGGWEPVPYGPTLGLGQADARVPALRRRLAAEGLLPGADPASTDTRFDSTVLAAVRSFQRRYGLEPDGEVGPSTLAALNTPVEERIGQLRVNLERARWTLPGLPERFVGVNVAAARVRVVDGDRVLFDRRAIVGKRSSPTPSFAATMTYVELNPTWTVPRGIVGEVLAQVRRDPTYLERQRIRVLDRSGTPVDPADVDFSRYSAADLPYVFRQEAGPLNPLGRIKLMFPNEHDVYLHDTPSRQLFENDDRLLSHGCVRVEDPLGLAEIALEGSSWDRAALSSAIDSGATRAITLPVPLPVFVLYWTAAGDRDGSVHYYPDVYGRDATVLAALDADVAGEAPSR